ncbi:hypothetical protein ACFR99_08135 [Haloarchaeobius amylolyticus]|uniref:Uncharacterized protein n=1 Tax=Haloarchaeobius amylolyticus TaxID=1198296 RepID=A0ABD6BG32_9EURY
MSDDYYTKADFADDLDESRFDRRPDEETVETVVSNVEDRNISVHVADDGEAAREQIPDGVAVMDGHFTTLEEIGFTDGLEAAEGFERSTTGWPPSSASASSPIRSRTPVQKRCAGRAASSTNSSPWSTSGSTIGPSSY